VPDATTVWLPRAPVQAKAIDKLFARFDVALKDRGYLAMGGQIIDATVVPAPKQRNTEAEKAAIKEGACPRTGSRPRRGKRIAMRAGRSSTARPRSGGRRPEGCETG
jgi:hypothetical protein